MQKYQSQENIRATFQKWGCTTLRLVKQAQLCALAATLAGASTAKCHGLHLEVKKALTFGAEAACLWRRQHEWEVSHTSSTFVPKTPMINHLCSKWYHLIILVWCTPICSAALSTLIQ